MNVEFEVKEGGGGFMEAAQAGCVVTSCHETVFSRVLCSDVLKNVLELSYTRSLNVKYKF